MEEDNLGILEMQVERLIKKYLDLAKENSILRQRLKSKEVNREPELDVVAEIKDENEALRDKNYRAVKRLKALLKKLEINAVGL
jgi:phage-related minor tail protein